MFKHGQCSYVHRFPREVVGTYWVAFVHSTSSLSEVDDPHSNQNLNQQFVCLGETGDSDLCSPNPLRIRAAVSEMVSPCGSLVEIMLEAAECSLQPAGLQQQLKESWLLLTWSLYKTPWLLNTHKLEVCTTTLAYISILRWFNAICSERSN